MTDYSYSEKTELTIGTSVTDVLSIDLSDLSVAKVPKNVLGDNRKKFRPSSLVDCGELTATILYSANDTYLSSMAAGTKLTNVALDFYNSDSTAATATLTWGDAYVIKWGLGNVGKEDANVENKVTIGFNDIPTVT